MAYGRKQERVEDPRFVRAGGLWKGRDRKDNEMLTGGILAGKLKDYADEIGLAERRDDERLPLLIFANTYKEEENHPDFNVYLGDPDKKREGKGKQTGYRRERDVEEERPTKNTDDRNEESEERQAPSRRAPKPTRPTTKKPEPKSRKGGDRKRLRLDR